MAKLTRTQKFANLRDSLANDKEPSLSTKELSSYEDRLASLTGESLEKQDSENFRKTLEEDPKYIWSAFEDHAEDNSYDPYSYSKQQEDDYFNNKYVWNSLQEFPEDSNSRYEIEDTLNIDELPDLDDEVESDDLTQVHSFEPVVIEDNTQELPVVDNQENETNTVEQYHEPVIEVHEEVVEQTPVYEQVVEQTPVVEEIQEQEENVYVAPVMNEAQLETETISTEEYIEQQEARYKDLVNTNPDIEAAYAEAEKRASEDEEVVEQVQEEVASLEQEVQETPVYEEAVVEQTSEEETPVYEEPIVEETIEEPVQEQHEEVVEEYQEPIVEQVVEENEEVDAEAEKMAAMQLLDDIVTETEQQEVVEEVVEETPVYEENVVETPVEEETVVEQEVQETPVYEEAVVEQTSEEETPVYEEVAVEETIEEPVQEQPEEVVEETVEENNEVEEAADNHEPEDIDQNNNSSLIAETIDEVGEYNRSVGEETITTLTNNLVQQVRHPGTTATRSEKHKYVEVPVNDASIKDDEEFSNTVSMEISKIMDEISNTQEVELPEISDVKPVEEHPVLTKALEEEDTGDVVEIKNLNEMEEELSTNTLSSTIPFVVAAGDEELIEDSDEDDSNTILNIILIVLIFILVAVLGLIIFYILKTKGII